MKTIRGNTLTRVLHGSIFPTTFAPQMNLSEANINGEFQINEILDAELEIKLMELGFSIGSDIQVLRKAPARGPLTIRNHKAQIIIRREDSQNVSVTPLKD